MNANDEKSEKVQSMSEMMVFTGNANPELALKVVERLDIPMGKAHVSRFSDGAVSVMEYKEKGFLPEALINYLVRLSWSHGDQEIFSQLEGHGQNACRLGIGCGIYALNQALQANDFFLLGFHQISYLVELFC